MSPTNGTKNGIEHRAIVDTHRHPWGKKMQAKMEGRGLLDPKQGFPQTNAQDLMAYREVSDLDYAMPIQREGGITLSLMTNGGEVAWIAHDLLQVSTVDGLKYLNDEYVDIMNRFPGEFGPPPSSRAGWQNPIGQTPHRTNRKKRLSRTSSTR